MITTWLTEQFGLLVPLVAAPMGGAATGAFAAEVSRWGALGMVAAGSRATAESIRTETSSLPADQKPWGIGALAWVVEQRPEIMEAVLFARPALVSVSYGPYERWIEPIHKAGSLATTQVGTLAEALAAEQSGIDFLVIRGSEGGGHGRDAMSTLPLLQEVLDRVGVPVLAAGGIATRRGLAAVLAAGAAGGWVGTAFLNCVETSWPDAARRRVVEAGDGATIYTTSFDSGLRLEWPPAFGGRALRNDFSERWHGRDPVDDAATEEMAAAVAARDFDIAPLWAGESVSLLGPVRTVADVIEEFRQAEALLRQW